MLIVLFLTYIFCLSQMQGDGLPLYYHWYFLRVTDGRFPPIISCFFQANKVNWSPAFFLLVRKNDNFGKVKFLPKRMDILRADCESGGFLLSLGVQVWLVFGVECRIFCIFQLSPPPVTFTIYTRPPESRCEDQDVPSISFSSGDPFGYPEAKMGGDLFHTTYFRPHCWIPITGNSYWRRLPASAGNGWRRPFLKMFETSKFRPRWKPLMWAPPSISPLSHWPVWPQTGQPGVA